MRSPLTVTVLFLFAGLVAACDSSFIAPNNAGDAILPERSSEVDLSRITPEFRQKGGNAFVELTGYPAPAVLAHLKSNGLAAAQGWSAIRVFENLHLNVAWGYIPAGGVESIAAIPFVVRIEPSEDPDGIFPLAAMEVNPMIAESPIH